MYPEEASGKVAGYKAYVSTHIFTQKPLTLYSTLSNPNVSEEAKENARQVLDTEFDGGNVGEGGTVGTTAQKHDSKNPNQVAGGLKA